jgi:predicted AlkP superfamily pyrophosphatase or phosphodiesterase
MKRFSQMLPLLLATLTVLEAAPPSKPKLVVAIMIDQFRYDYLLRFRSEYHSGLAHLLDQGAVFSNAHLIHAATVTAVGHSTFLSGAPPAQSGIIANEWFDRELGKSITSVYDPKTKLVGGVPDAEGSSPRRLLVSTIGDELKIANSDSKVIGISIKDRGSILPSGHMADAAYWYDPDSNHWVTSTYYRAGLPGWVQAVNDENTYRRYLGANWMPLNSKEDAKPFCTMANGNNEIRFCGGLEATPWGNEMIEQFAEQAIAGEDLGHHSSTDLLTVSFSSNDYVGHAVGPDDPAVRDISLRTDLLLGKFLEFIDQHVGAGNALIVLSADHGVAPVPEVNQARNMPGGRLSDFRLNQKMTDALNKRYGAARWLMSASPVGMLYLDMNTIRTRKLNVAEVEETAAQAARAEDHIARVYTHHELMSGQVQQDQIGRAFSLGFFGPRSGDLFILQEPYYLFDSTGTSHGTPYGYDTHVPVIFWGPGIKPGSYSESITANDIAPTLASILQVEPPSGAIGRILTEILQ